MPLNVVSDETLADAVAALPGRPRVVASGNAVAPFHALRVIDKAVEQWRLYMLNAPSGIPVGERVRLETSFVGAGMRDRPELRYIPSRLSMVPLLFRDTRPPDVVVVHTSAPHDGKVSLGCEVNILPAAIEAARARGGLVVAQVNRNVPYTFGDGEIPVEDVDLAVEVDEPVDCPVPREPDDVSREIAERVAALVGDGATLQLGIGAVPDATLAAVRAKGLRIWSEMFSDGVLALDRAGRLDPDVPVTASFCFGTPELLAWADRNPRVRMLRT